MDAETIRAYCLAKRGANEGFPFGDETLVFKVREKIFLLLSLTAVPLRFNAKCDPDKAVELRERYEAILPGYHMNKRLWNTVVLDGTLPGELLWEMIDDSYNLVVASLPFKARQALLPGAA